MNEETKYVIVKDIFGENAYIFSSVKSHGTIKGENAIAAGFVSFRKNDEGMIEVFCYGRSFSCDLDNRGIDDAKLICRALNPIHNKIFIPVEK